MTIKYIQLGIIIPFCLPLPILSPSYSFHALFIYLFIYSSHFFISFYLLLAVDLHKSEEPGSSGSIVSDYGLDDRAIGVRVPAETKDFSSILCVQTGSEAHPASCTMGTGGPFPGRKARPGRDADHSPPSSAEVISEKELYLLSPPSASMACRWAAFFWLFYINQLIFLSLNSRRNKHYSKAKCDFNIEQNVFDYT
jgi:hypothetical protein